MEEKPTIQVIDTEAKPVTINQQQHVKDLGPFKFSIDQLQSLVDPKSIQHLQQLGGTSALVSGLHSNVEYGLSNSDTIAVPTDSKTAITLSTRREIYGENRLPPVKSKSFLRLVFEALQDKVMILLSIAALVSLAIGIYQDVTGAEHDVYTDLNNNSVVTNKPHWIEGVAIIIAVLIVVLVGSVNDFRKEKQFQKLNSKKEDRKVKVTRDGSTLLLSVFDLVVGDIVLLEPGEIVPVDGVLISGSNLTCDESSATGESDAIRKRTLEEITNSVDDTNSAHTDTMSALPSIRQMTKPAPTIKADPFLISGSKVLEGVGSYLVINVGPNSFNGKIMMNLRSENVETPLQQKLGDLADRISKLGGAAALLMLIVLLIRYFAAWNSQKQDAASVLSRIVGIIITTITVVVVAVPEGLPLAVTLALAFATVRMLKDNNLVRLLSSCETMGSATTVCSDKTGTLTQNRMTLVAGTFGTSAQFLANANSLPNIRSTLPPLNKEELPTALPATLKELLVDSIAINSSAFQSTDDKGNVSLIGSKTEVALLEWIPILNSSELKDLRNKFKTIELWPFSSESKSMSTLIKLHNDDLSYRLFIKGASEIILSKCNMITSFKTLEESKSDSISVLEISDRVNMAVQHRISEYASESLRTIGLAYKDINLTQDQLDQLSTYDSDRTRIFWQDLCHQTNDLVLLGIVGIEDPLREGVPEAVAACARAGVAVRMVTGDNVLTAKSIAKKCGIYTENSIIMEGPEFRKLTSDQLNLVLPKLRVLARSSPEDKMKLVQHLRALGEVVAVTGDGTNDAPALKAADVGFSMGIAGTEVAKEASSIILMDDNFASIVKAITWGRTVNDAIKKFLQFQLTVNVTAVLVTFVSAVASNEEKSVLKAVQLLWVNLIMDTLAALALATDPPTKDVLNRPPDRRNSSLISVDMWKMILGQAVFQVVICFTLLYSGPLFYKDDVADTIEETILDTIVFNAFVFMQIFNQLNARRVDSNLNVFAGIHKNYYFLTIFFIVLLLQVLIVQFGGSAFETVPLDGLQWLVCIGIGFLSLPIGCIIRLIPNDLFAALRSKNRHPNLNNGTNQLEETPLARIQQSLGPTSYSPRRSFFTATMVPSLVATSVGVGLTPHNTAPVDNWLGKSNDDGTGKSNPNNN